MSLKYLDFIYLSPGFSPDKNTLETNSSTCRFKAVGIDVFQKELVIEVAKNLYQKVCRRLKFVLDLAHIGLQKSAKQLKIKSLLEL